MIIFLFIVYDPFNKEKQILINYYLINVALSHYLVWKKLILSMLYNNLQLEEDTDKNIWIKKCL